MKPITYPMRPASGGSDPMKAVLPGDDWIFEPKVNGWRTLVHTPTGTMFNRHGERLSIESEFRTVLSTLSGETPAEWLDCEAFERRHPLGKGSLVILDAVVPDLTFMERQQFIYDTYVANGIAQAWGFEQFEPPPDRLLHLAYSYYKDGDPDLSEGWRRLQECNKALGCDLFEGVVAKRNRSLYQIQLDSPDKTSTDWIKFRWKW